MSMQFNLKDNQKKLLQHKKATRKPFFKVLFFHKKEFLQEIKFSLPKNAQDLFDKLEAIKKELKEINDAILDTRKIYEELEFNTGIKFLNYRDGFAHYEIRYLLNNNQKISSLF